MNSLSKILLTSAMIGALAPSASAPPIERKPAPKIPLTKKQKKSRAKSMAARKARKITRKHAK